MVQKLHSSIYVTAAPFKVDRENSNKQLAKRNPTSASSPNSVLRGVAVGPPSDGLAEAVVDVFANSAQEHREGNRNPNLP